MAKTDQELDELKKRVDSLRDELKTLSDDELAKVAGGFGDTGFPILIGLKTPEEYFQDLPK